MSALVLGQHMSPPSKVLWAASGARRIDPWTLPGSFERACFSHHLRMHAVLTQPSQLLCLARDSHRVLWAKVMVELLQKTRAHTAAATGSRASRAAPKKHEKNPPRKKLKPTLEDHSEEDGAEEAEGIPEIVFEAGTEPDAASKLAVEKLLGEVDPMDRDKMAIILRSTAQILSFVLSKLDTPVLQQEQPVAAGACAADVPGNQPTESALNCEPDTIMKSAEESDRNHQPPQADVPADPFKLQNPTTVADVPADPFKLQNPTTVADVPADPLNPTTVADVDDANVALAAILDSRASLEALLSTSSEQPAPSSLTGIKLTEFQLTGFRWLLALHARGFGAILADEMGLGKTIQTITLLLHLHEQAARASVRAPCVSLIVCPLSVCGHWALELHRFAPSLRVLRLSGSKPVRLGLYEQTGRKGDPLPDIILMQYESVLSDSAELNAFVKRRIGRLNYVVVDEGHRIRSQSSKLGKALRSLPSMFRLVLTGTPLSNDVGELTSLLNFVFPNVFSGWSFSDWFCRRNDQLSEQERLLIISRMHMVLKPFLLRRTKEVISSSLPPKTESVVTCPLSGLQSRLYSVILDPALRRESGVTSCNRLMDLRKIVNHPFILYDDPVFVFAPSQSRRSDLAHSKEWIDVLVKNSGKFAYFEFIIQRMISLGHTVLVFSQLKETLNFLEDLLNHHSIRWVRIDGNSSGAERVAAIDSFNTENIPVFLLSTRAGGTGLNLQRADTVIMFDCDFNPQMDLQAKARTWRLGQTRPVHVITLVSDTPLERSVLSIAEKKKLQEHQIIQAGCFDTTSRSECDHRSVIESLWRSICDQKPNSIIASGARENSPRQLLELLCRNSCDREQLLLPADKQCANMRAPRELEESVSLSMLNVKRTEQNPTGSRGSLFSSHDVIASYAAHRKDNFCATDDTSSCTSSDSSDSL